MGPTTWVTDGEFGPRFPAQRSFGLREAGGRAAESSHAIRDRFDAAVGCVRERRDVSWEAMASNPFTPQAGLVGPNGSR